MLKTYNARTMADALAQVKRDLGRDAVIVHTRSFRVGGVLGFGGRPMVEVTATTGKAAGEHAPRRVSTRAVGRVPVARQDAPENAAATLASSIVTKPIRPAARHAHNPSPTAALAHAAGAAATAGGSPEPDAATYTPPSSPVVPAPTTVAGAEPAPARIDNGRRAVTHEGGLPGPSCTPEPLRGALERAASVLAERAARLEQAEKASTPSEPDRAESSQPAQNKSHELLAAIPLAQAPGQAAPPQPSKGVRPTTIESKPAPDRPASRPEALEHEIGELRRMMGQVLVSTRRAATRNGGGASGAFDGATPEPLLDLYTRLTDADVDADEAERIVGEVRDELGHEQLRDERVVREAALRRIEQRLPTGVEAPRERDASGRPSVIALVGPTGVGKTTTVAKLAATHKLRHAKRVGLITTDTYRIAAVEQLRTYAGIIGLPLKVAMTPADVASAIEALSDCDLIVMDTAGRSQNDAKRLDELRAFLEAAKADQTHMVISTTVGRKVLERTIERFGALGPDRAILTKLDEAESFGMILEAARLCGLPISYVTTGQEVPDDMEAARPDRLARMVLGDGVEVGR